MLNYSDPFSFVQLQSIASPLGHTNYDVLHKCHHSPPHLTPPELHQASLLLLEEFRYIGVPVVVLFVLIFSSGTFVPAIFHSFNHHHGWPLRLGQTSTGSMVSAKSWSSCNCWKPAKPTDHGNQQPCNVICHHNSIGSKCFPRNVLCYSDSFYMSDDLSSKSRI
jgi:hypothetical protein